MTTQICASGFYNSFTGCHLADLITKRFCVKNKAKTFLILTETDILQRRVAPAAGLKQLSFG